MPLSDIVNVTITTTNPGVTQAGFGVPLIASASASWSEHSRSYTGLTGVLLDFAATTPEYLAAQALFAQSPAPPRILIGRLEHKPTMVQVISVKTVQSSTIYRVHAFAAGVLQTASFTSDSSATNDEIIAGVVSALNALAAPDIGATAASTGSVGSKVCTVTGDASGNWFSLEPLAESTTTQISALLEVADTSTDPSTSTSADLDAILADSTDWYGLVLLFKSYDIVTAAAGWAETHTKIFAPSSADTQIATIADGSATDIAKHLKSQARARTGVFFHARGYEFADCAQMGRFFPVDPGGDNWRLKTLSGVTPSVFTSTQVDNLIAKYCNYYDILGGKNVIQGEGKVAANEYIDVIRFRDWYVARLSERVVNKFINAEKIPYTDDGIAVIEGEIRAQNKDGIAAKGIATTPAPTVTVPKVADVSSADKLARVVRGVNTTWTLAGAINKLLMNVQVNA